MLLSMTTGLSTYVFATHVLASRYAWVVGALSLFLPFYILKMYMSVVWITIESMWILYAIDLDGNMVHWNELHSWMSKKVREAGRAEEQYKQFRETYAVDSGGNVHPTQAGASGPSAASTHSIHQDDNVLDLLQQQRIQNHLRREQLRQHHEQRQQQRRGDESSRASTDSEQEMPILP